MPEPAPNFLLRAAVEADAETLARIYAWHVLNGFGTFDEIPPTAETFVARMADVRAHGLPWLIAEANGTALGYAYAAGARERSAYRFTVEDSVYVAPDAQRRGVGRALLSALVEECAKLGLHRMIAAIGDSGNAASIGLHEACGFTIAGRLHEVGFKQGRWLDVVWMQRPL